jgi:xylulokinase
VTDSEKYVLAIDLGTSGPKVALVSTAGEVVGCEFEPNELILLPGGGAEQDPDEWWRTIVTAAKRVLARDLCPVEEIVAVSCTTQWSGTVAVDGAGRHLHNAIIWMDSRGSRHIERITGGLLSVEGYGLRKLWPWLRLTGGMPAQSGKDSLAHILYLKHERPDLYAGTATFLEPKDYINLRLTGRVAASYDSITLHWVTDNRDVDRVRYHPKLLRLAGIDPGKLPELKRATDVLGPLRKEVADELGLTAGVPVMMGTPDIHSAAIGSGAVRDYEAHLYIGTSDWLTCHVPFKKTDVLHSLASIPAAIPGRYLVANEQETAGKCLTFLRDNVLLADDELGLRTEVDDVYAAFDRIAATVPAGSGKLIFTPWLYGERTPVEDHAVRAGLFNLSLETTRAHIIRAVLEGVAYNIRWLLGHVEAFTRRRLDSLNFIGGGAASELWCQILADVLDRTIRQVADPIQANVRGAGMLAAIGLGHLSVDEVSERTRITRSFVPNGAHRHIYDELFDEFRAIYRDNKKTYHRLNRAG